jgi:predicted phage replisome organizer
MAEVKWVKLTTDMFDNRKIKHLRRLPEGNNIVLIWVMLLTMAGRCNSGGMIFLTENIPYTPKMLADELDFEENTVTLALQALEQLDMIVTDNGFFTIAGWEEYQNIEGMEKIREQNRLRQQKRREKNKQALIGSGNVCEYCGKEGTTIDHIIPKTSGGLDLPENTVCSCLACNMKKTNRRIDVFLNEMMHSSADFEFDRIITNKKIMKYVIFDDAEAKFLSRDVTGQVTECHGIEEEREKDKEKEIHSINHSAESEYIQKKIEESELEGESAEKYKEQLKEDLKQKYFSGSLGKGVVFMSNEQFSDLCDKLSIDELDKYIGIVAECERNGKHFKKKTHYQAILDMAAKDRKVGK